MSSDALRWQAPFDETPASADQREVSQEGKIFWDGISEMMSLPVRSDTRSPGMTSSKSRDTEMKKLDLAASNPEKEAFSSVVGCARYEQMNSIIELEGREPTPEELDILLRHEESCSTGLHSVASLEKKLGLPKDSIENGSEEHKLLPAESFVAQFRKMHSREKICADRSKRERNSSLSSRKRQL